MIRSSRWQFGLACLFFAASAFGQTNQTCSLPLVVTQFNSSSGKTEFMRDLNASNLKIELASRAVTPVTARIDDGPKRIVLVIDDTPQIAEPEWKLQTDFVLSFLAHARDNDEFALVFVSSHGEPKPFQSVAKIRALLRESASRANQPRSMPGTLAALQYAAELFEPPKFGDTLFLFGHDAETGSVAEHDQVRDLMLKNGIRFLALSLADPLAKLPRGTDLNKPLPAPFGPSKLAMLGIVTGGGFSYTSMKVLASRNQVAGRKEHLADLYAGIAAPYRISVPAFPARSNLKITVKDASRREIWEGGVYYPHVVSPCAAR
jgi:hypothetical protein